MGTIISCHGVTKIAAISSYYRRARLTAISSCYRLARAAAISSCYRVALVAAISSCYIGARIFPRKRCNKGARVILKGAGLGSARIPSINRCYRVGRKSVTSTGFRVARESCYKQLMLGSQNRPG